ncbi:CYTH domain-containing protein [Thiohalocapsa marina]|uniref:CYTH domain-containing protein n=1 Tax=Thiohalocapsa marina TaxID=424902 RepID=A0A5M8FNQ7_9GAMM|nr:CYTH domain-containing protein [Thiohalocapsa marina]KAA6185630.1 CYTH domain-containing protein [Thiohalocapsa marina]
MATEIERKFLVEGDAWREDIESEAQMVQGYLTGNQAVTLRVRVKGDAAFLTVKGQPTGISRSEFEYPIPVTDAEAMLKELAVSPPIEKTRYRVRCGAHLWEVDVFAGANAGLVMAEVELDSEDEAFERPDWAGREVTGDRRYYNASLAQHPFSTW